MAEEIRDNLRAFFNKIAKERGYNNAIVNIQDISTEGANYSNTLYVVTVSEPPKEDLKLFAKVAIFDEALRETSDMFTLSMENEYAYYSELAVAFERLYNKHDVKINERLRISKYYGREVISNQETIVLENLAANGYENFDRFKSVDWEYASAAISELAKFHAVGIAAKVENVKELERIKEIGLDTFSMEDMKDVFTKQAVKIGMEIIKEEYRAKLQDYLTEEKMLYDLALLWKPFNESFLIHGDYRPNNLMHRVKGGKVEIVPLDFQTLRFGYLVVDLLYFIWCGSDSEFRQKHYKQLVELYYSELTIALKNLHVDIDEVYPRTTFEAELEDNKTLGLMLGLSMIPLLLVEPENAPKIDSIQNLALKPSKLALERATGIVEDYINWGII